jgi:myo-inositol 2-dehydrogenase / D-chiro-inositol 1-dehydrogenase
LSELRLGLIGCGRIAQRGYVPALARARGVRLAAVADPVSERCAQAAPGLPCFPSAGDLLEAGAADALVLASPAHAHLHDARLAARLGVPTLGEKPPAPTAAEAAELAALDPPPWISFNRRFDPGIRGLRREVRDEDALQLNLLFRARLGAWGPFEVAYPILLDVGPHLVDLALWLSSGRPERVTGKVEKHRATLAIELAEGRGSAHIECAGNRLYRERVEVKVRGKTLRYERGGLLDSLRSLVGAAGESPLVPSLTEQLEAFARAARGNAEPDLATAADGSLVMRTLEQMQAPA